MVMLRNLRLAWRRLGHSLVFLLSATTVFGLGLGATVYMFTVLNGVYLEGLPVAEPHEIAYVETRERETSGRGRPVWPLDFLEWRSQAEAFETLDAYRRKVFNVSFGSQAGVAQRVAGAWVTATALKSIGASPVLGRAFLDTDFDPGATKVAVLGHGLWRTRLGGDRGVLGRTARIDGVETTIVGVMPPGLRFPLREDLWLPLSLRPTEIRAGEGPRVEVFGRLRQGVDLERAQVELRRLSVGLARRFPETHEGLEITVYPFTQHYLGPDEVQVLATMMGVVIAVLMIACTNVASLCLSRAVRRKKDFAVRAALGASRWELAGEVLAESLLLSCAGAVLSLALATLGIRLTLRAFRSFSVPYWWNLDLDPRVFGILVLATMVSSLLAGAVPALRAAGVRPADVLRDAARASSSFGDTALGRWFLVAQTAVSCMLLIAVGLMTRSAINATTLDVGATTEGFLAANLHPPPSSAADLAARHRFYERLEEKLRRHPGFSRATLATTLPGTWPTSARYETDLADPQDPDPALPHTYLSMVAPSFFHTFDIPLLSGRAFDTRDHASSVSTAIVSERLAELAWGDVDPIGRRIRVADDGPPAWRTVIGVVPNVVQSLRVEDRGILYLPLAQAEAAILQVAVKARDQDLNVSQSLQAAAAELDRDIALDRVEPLADKIERDYAGIVFLAKLFAIFGCVALVLVAAGTYGFTAYVVSRRSREIGIRRALGAQTPNILFLISREGLLQLAAGGGAGVVLGYFGSRFLGSVLLGLEPRDTLVYLVAFSTLSLVLLAACTVPARHALTLDVVDVLRSE